MNKKRKNTKRNLKKSNQSIKNFSKIIRHVIKKGHNQKHLIIFTMNISNKLNKN